MPTPASEAAVTAPGLWTKNGKWYLYKDRKFWHKDVDMIADMRRAGIVSNVHQLEGESLRDFVHRCLDVEDYRVMGIGFEPHDIAYLRQLAQDQPH